MTKGKNKKEILIALDRDGTLIHDDGYFGKSENWKKELTFYDGAIDMIKELNKFSKVILTTNQIGVAYGFYTKKRVEEIHKHIQKELEKNNATILNYYYCPYVEKKWAKTKNIDLNSEFVLENFPKNRKPNIGMLEKAAKDLKKSLDDFQIFVIGDSIDDMEMAENVNGTGVFFRNGKNEKVFKEIKHKKNIYSIKKLKKAPEVLKKLLT